MKTITQQISFTQKFIWITLFSIAMGYLESAVVIYIRIHYYPNGFDFPLVPIDKSVAITEFFREVATMIMLAGIGILVGENRKQRFAYFVYSFAIWDLFYYVFLYVILGWPKSLMTFDVLFLIPCPWISPVLCPCLVASLMIVYALIIIFGEPEVTVKGLRRRERAMLAVGSCVVLYSFISDYVNFVLKHHADKGVWTFSQRKNLFEEGAGFVPHDFNWLVFIPGFIIMSGAIIIFGMRAKPRRNEYREDEWKQVA